MLKQGSERKQDFGDIDCFSFKEDGDISMKVTISIGRDVEVELMLDPELGEQTPPLFLSKSTKSPSGISVI